ncbi:uncharacterized protein MYCGRDRAFT_48195 [Zymoseptoria tritici IPO323]|uniref:Nephrocystin 3-like N-terminal domain-containing protein n=1 Tax=Zymoseptoria tritici (strain CBS 115943 / IPO323) TaxID=336722 RepID=F9XK50_ZYMTI|nr:uncharacterized protein MYCGRDRAFT_48195 [Zymoseptoria tritici IPO323]EGP84576.1 hypothetical protein MYCGRDRAFT_48195 [Zymoseptoria tritici IPO323]
MLTSSPAVQVSARLVQTTRQLSRTGARDEFVEIEDQTKVVKGLLARLNPGLNTSAVDLSQDDKDLAQLCEQSQDVSKQLLEMLASCRAKAVSGRVSLDAFWSSVKSEWKENDINQLRKRLETIDTRAHRLLSMGTLGSVLSELSGLDQQVQVLGDNQRRDLADIKDAVQQLIVERFNGDIGRHLELTATARGGRGKDFAVQAGILTQLRFDEIDRRLHELDQRPSHEKSYLWLDGSIGGAKKVGLVPANFQAWLSSTQKLYWISGVAGSGKSTLMKFLYSNPQTTTQLKDVWYQDGKLLVAAYFFWEVGKIQLLRTQQGLLRTLLFQILRQCPELMSEVYSDLWTLFAGATPNGQRSLSGFAGSRVSLDVHQLLEKMETACRSIAGHGYHLFLLVDGLDEYEGKASEIIKLMTALTRLPNVKICISSRPDTAFMDAYGSMTTKLFMEDFNTPDITQYVQHRLESHSRFKEDGDRDTLGRVLIKTVVDDSCGVFLWVRLVMEDLEEGLTDCNTIAQLQRRLARLPKELESFFDHMLDRVHEDYQKDSYSMLSVTYHAHDLLAPLACWFISERSSELDGFHEIKPTESRRNHKRRKDIDFRLRSYCRGLLVVQEVSMAADWVSRLISTGMKTLS